MKPVVIRPFILHSVSVTIARGEIQWNSAVDLAPGAAASFRIKVRHSNSSTMCLGTSRPLSGVIVGPFPWLVPSENQKHKGIPISQLILVWLCDYWTGQGNQPKQFGDMKISLKYTRRLRKLTVENLSLRAPAVTSGHEQHNQATETPGQGDGFEEWIRRKGPVLTEPTLKERVQILKMECSMARPQNVVNR